MLVILEGGGCTAELLTDLLGMGELTLFLFERFEFARLHFSFLQLVVLEL